MSAVPQVPNRIGGERFPRFSNVETGITAHAGGGQTLAYQLVAQVNRVATVASGNDSVKLPKITPTPGQLGSVGTIVFLTNAAAVNALKVYGSDPDTINAVATGTGNAVSAGVSVILVADSYTQSTNVGTWRMINSTASAVAAFTSGTIDGVVIGGGTPAAGHFTTVSTTGVNSFTNAALGAAVVGNTFTVTVNAPNNQSGMVAYCEADISGTTAGHCYGFGSWINTTSPNPVLAAGHIITPYEGGVYTGEAQANARIVFAGQHQAVLGGAPATLHAWRLNTNQVTTALIAAGNSDSIGYTTGSGASAAVCGYIPIADIAGGPGIVYVRCYATKT